VCRLAVNEGIAKGGAGRQRKPRPSASGRIDASRRLATKWADARRGAEHGKLPQLLRRSPPINVA